jgi:hypothetical protein
VYDGTQFELLNVVSVAASGGTIANLTLSGALNTARSTVAATATTTPLWASTNGNVQDWTGTPTITDFPAAPQAGAQREIHPTAGTVFTNSGNISVQGGATYTSVAGDTLFVTAITPTTFYISGTFNRNSADARYAALLGNSANNFSVAAATAAAHAARYDQTLGLGQTLTQFNQTSRPLNTTFTNSTGRWIFVMCAAQVSEAGSSFSSQFYVNGVGCVSGITSGNSGTHFNTHYAFVPIPPGATYQFQSASFLSWVELR